MYNFKILLRDKICWKMMDKEPIEFLGRMVQPEALAFMIGFCFAPIYICILHAFPGVFRAQTAEGILFRIG